MLSDWNWTSMNDELGISRGELVDLLRDYGSRENEDHYLGLDDTELREEVRREMTTGGEFADAIAERAAEQPECGLVVVDSTSGSSGA